MTKNETKIRPARQCSTSEVFVSSLEFRPSSLIRGFEFRHSNFAALLCCLLIPFLAGGCIFYKTDPSAKQVTSTDPNLGTPDYWWNKPTTAHVAGPDFEKLWSACKGELYVRLFPLDREQYREGLLSSESVVSQQFFEPWRNDTANVGDLLESSLATIRRTVRIEVTRKPDGTYEASPKVLVERFNSSERRLTSIEEYHQAFNGTRTFNDSTDESGAVLQADYWYAVRRDANLEKAMADSIRHALESRPTGLAASAASVAG